MPPGSSGSAPELWGGVECARVRIGSRVVDQLELTGHAQRDGDLDLFAELGIRALRYPVLWERVEGRGLGEPDWSWTDRRLTRMRELDIRPIVGLLHHGNGPRGTSLLDRRFPERFAAYAARVAERYPWVDSYVPVNEPLTTARFSGLYGIWYPHGRDPRIFARIVLNQLRATVLAMREIRNVQPRARLIQNEDVGTVLASPALMDTARVENERRWLTFDLLFGRVLPGTELWEHLRSCGAPLEEIAWFAENPCPPDVLGVDHYVTSDRMLDERVDLYPASSLSEGDVLHANVDAVRASAATPPGLEGAMRGTWQRYGAPIAAAEVHIGSTRDEQMRWLNEAWNAARALARDGVDVRAVTSWALLGAFEWNSLLVREEGFYESGAFDLRQGSPRPTGIAHLIRELAKGGEASHPVLEQPGWWRRPERIRYGPLDIGDAARSTEHPSRTSDPRTFAIVGDPPEPLTHALMRIASSRALAPLPLDLGAGVRDALGSSSPWLVAIVLPERCHDDRRVTEIRDAAQQAIGAVGEAGARLMLFSNDSMFRGPGPYGETASGDPADGWGLATVDVERVALAEEGSIVIRTGPRFGPWDPAPDPGRRSREVADLVAPSYLPDVVNLALDLAIDRERGIWHLVNGAPVTLDQARELAEVLAPGTDLTHLFSAARGALGTDRGARMPTLEHAVIRCFGEPEDLLFPQVDEPFAGDVEELAIQALDLRSAPGFVGRPDEPSSTRSP